MKKQLIECALGNIVADMVIANVNVFHLSDGSLEQCDIAVCNGKIAGLGNYKNGKKIIDGSNLYAALLDVRTPEEHKTGYLEGAVLLPPAVPVTINLNDCKLENLKVYLLDEEHDLTETNCTCNADGSVTFNMKGNSVVYVEG